MKPAAFLLRQLHSGDFRRLAFCLWIVLASAAGGADTTVRDTTYNGTTTVEADGNLSTAGTVTALSGSNLTFRASGEIRLNPGFSALAGSTFSGLIGAVQPPSVGYKLTVKGGSPLLTVGLRDGDRVDISADDPGDGRQFTGWTISGKGSIDNARSPTATITMGAGDCNVIASFSRPTSTVDSDGDGMDDAWERLHFGGLQEGAQGDFDKDGWSNIAEYNLVDLDPTVADLTGAKLGSKQTNAWPTADPTKTEAVGVTPGAFEVDASGAATYTIPIYTPPGINGVQPSIALRYSSSGANGILGIGWSIDGLSSIAKGRIDDELLRAVGDGYRTERESFSKIGGSGSSGYWLKTKSGLVLNYGAHVASRNGNGIWMLNRTTDAHGNYIDYKYNGIYPKNIDYTGRVGVEPVTRIAFEYEPRSDSVYLTNDEDRILIDERLKAIKVYLVEGSALKVLRAYELEYEESPISQRSRIKSIQESGLDGAVLPKTQFAWSSEDHVKFTKVFSGELTNAQNTVFFADVNRDGMEDMIQVGLAPDRAVDVYLWKAQQNKFERHGDQFLLKQAGYSYDDIAVGDVDGDGVADITSFFLSVGGSNHTYKRRVWLGKGDGTFREVADNNQVVTGAHGTPFVAPKNYLVDLEGKGYLSLLMVFPKTYSEAQGWKYYNYDAASAAFKEVVFSGSSNTLYPGAEFPVYFVNYNDDSRIDYLVPEYLESNVGPGAGYTKGTVIVTAPGEPYKFFPGDFLSAWYTQGFTFDFYSGDFMGDGVTELLAKSRERLSTWPNELLMRLERNFAPGGMYSVITHPNVGPFKLTVVDVNSDGRDDFLVQRGDGSQIWLSVTVNRQFKFQQTADFKEGPWETELCIPLDVDGDGRMDLFIRKVGEKAYRVMKAEAGSAPRDVITAITDGLGASTEINYQPLSDPEVYTRRTDAPAGTINVTPSLQVVRSVVFDLGGSHNTLPGDTIGAGANAKYTLTYKYEGLRFGANRGLLGFAAQEVLDSRTGLTTRVERRHTVETGMYPLNGFVEKVTVKRGSVVLEETEITPGWKSLNGGKTLFVYPALTQRKSWGISAELDKQSEQTSNITVSQAFDDWGNLTQVVTDFGFTGEERIQVVDIAYHPEKVSGAQWILGRASSITETSSAKDQADVERVTKIYYRDNDGITENDSQGSDFLPTKVVQFPDDPARKLETVIGYTDGYGYANKVTVTGRKNATEDQTRTVEYEYDTSGRFVHKIKRTAPTSAGGMLTDTFVADQKHAAPENHTDWNGEVTTYGYDDFGRLTTITSRGITSETTLAWTTDSRGVFSVETKSSFESGAKHASPASFAVIDRVGRVTRNATINPDGNPVWMEVLYDSNGRLFAQSTPVREGVTDADTRYWRSTEYDGLGRMKKHVAPNGSTLTRSYNGREVTTTVSGSYDGKTTTQKTRAVHDPLGRVTAAYNNEDMGELRERDAMSYKYGPAGELVEINAAGVITSAEYDARGLPKELEDPNHGLIAYKHNAFGELYEVTKGTGDGKIVISYEYDILGRLVSRSEPEGKTTWQYDTAAGKGKGRMASVSGPDAAGGTYAEILSYDANLSRLSSVTRTIAGQSYVVTAGFDGASRITSLKYTSPNGSGTREQIFRYAYGTMGALREMRDGSAPNYSDGQTLWALMEANAFSRPAKEYYGNGVESWSGYEQTTGMLGQRVVSARGNLYQSLGLEHDPFGNVRSRKLHNGENQVIRAETYGYDLLNRLVSVTLNGNVTQAMEYSVDGNIQKKSGIGDYLYEGGQAHAVTKSGATTYQYDAFGNLTHRNGTKEIDWTSFNQPKTIKRGGESAFRYDADGGRTQQVKSTGETVTYMGSHEHMLKGARTEYRYRVVTPGGLMAQVTRDENAARLVHYFGANQIGSIEAIIDERGERLEDLSFDAWGKRRRSDWTSTASERSTAIDRGFTGHEMLDHLGLIHMNGRIFDPEIGRFLGADPVVSHPFVAQTYNGYSYTANNPINRTDPTGFTTYVDFYAPWYYGSTGGLNVYSGGSGSFSFSIGYGSFGSQLYRPPLMARRVIATGTPPGGVFTASRAGFGPVGNAPQRAGIGAYAMGTVVGLGQTAKGFLWDAPVGAFQSLNHAFWHPVDTLAGIADQISYDVRYLTTNPGGYIRDFGRSAASSWNRFWADPNYAGTLYFEAATLVAPVAKAAGITRVSTAAESKVWSRAPQTLQDQMALGAAQSGAGTKIIDNLGHPKFKGMEKWEYKVKSSEGRDSVIHYVRDPKTGELMDFKFKKHSNDTPTLYERTPEPSVSSGNR
jgi:RHS repeat-associated protein